MIVILDVQHCGKISRPNDRGASYKEYKEAYLVYEYVLKTFKYISENTDINIFIMSYGNYYFRHKLVNGIKADLYLACHLNSAPNVGGNYSLVEYYITQVDSNNTKKAAEIFSNNFRETLPVEKSVIKIIDKTNLGHYCIKSVICPSLILEPLFLNNDEHLDFILNYDYKIAGSIAKSIKEYGEYLNANT